MKTNVALIGFMGTGKTAVGRVLAEKLKKQFVELDTLIERRAGNTITEIFRDEGEIAFREMEIAVVKEISKKGNQVIACGGGVVLNKINIDRLHKNSSLVCLTASPSVILRRTSVSNERPLLDTQDRLSSIRELLKFRKPFYERAADYQINTSRLSIEAIIDQLVEKLRQDEGFRF